MENKTKQMGEVTSGVEPSTPTLLPMPPIFSTSAESVIDVFTRRLGTLQRQVDELQALANHQAGMIMAKDMTIQKLMNQISEVHSGFQVH